MNPGKDWCEMSIIVADVHLGLPERGRSLTSQEAVQRCLIWSID